MPDTTLVIDLIQHLDAGDRTRWQGDQGERPLSGLGRRQAVVMADVLADDRVVGLYSSRSLRCLQSLEPLAERLGLEVAVLPEVSEEEAWRRPDGWEGGPDQAPFAAGRVFAGLARLRERHAEGRVIVCSHGHVIPAFAAFLVAAYELQDVPRPEHRGQWYRLRQDGGRPAIERLEAVGFPLS